jgi:transcriptional regulator with XRE-family HTH domain
MQANVTLHPGPGEDLRRTREARGLELEQIAEATCIGARYLRALEDGAPLHEFPAPVYARFFLREYARYLGMEEDPLVRAFESRYGEDLVEDDVLDLPEPVRERRGGWRFLTALSVVGLLVLAGVTISSRTPVSTGIEERSGRVARHLSPGAGGRHRDPIHPVTRIRAVVDVNLTSFVAATADGQGVLYQTVAGGTTIPIRADRRLMLTIGSGDGVRLAVNGRRVGVGSGKVSLAILLRNGFVQIRHLPTT